MDTQVEVSYRRVLLCQSLFANHLVNLWHRYSAVLIVSTRCGHCPARLLSQVRLTRMVSYSDIKSRRNQTKTNSRQLIHCILLIPVFLVFTSRIQRSSFVRVLVKIHKKEALKKTESLTEFAATIDAQLSRWLSVPQLINMFGEMFNASV